MSRNAFEMRCWDMPFISLQIIKWVFFSGFPQTWEALFSSRMSCKTWEGSFETAGVRWGRWGEAESELMRLMDRKSSPKRGICKTLATIFINPRQACTGDQFSSVQSLSRVWLFAIPWTAACQASCPSPTPRAYSNSCPSRQWCHSTILSSVVPSPPAFNLSQNQGFFQWVGSSHQVAKVLEFQLQHQLPMNIKE